MLRLSRQIAARGAFSALHASRRSVMLQSEKPCATLSDKIVRGNMPSSYYNHPNYVMSREKMLYTLWVDVSEFTHYVRRQGRQLEQQLYERHVSNAASLRSRAFDEQVHARVRDLCVGLTQLRQAEVENVVVNQCGLTDERLITCLVPYRIAANIILARMPADVRAEALQELQAEERAIADCVPPCLTALPTQLTTSSSPLRQIKKNGRVTGSGPSKPVLPVNRWIQWYDADVYVFEGRRYLERLASHATTRTPRIPVFALLGSSGHGKTTLLDAMHEQDSEKAKEAAVYGFTHALRAFTFCPPTATCASAETWTEHVPTESQPPPPSPPLSSLCVTVIDTPGQRCFVETRLHVHMIADCILLVISAVDGLQSQTHEAIKVALNVDKPIVVVFTKMDLLNDVYTAQDTIRRLMNDLDMAGLTVKLVRHRSELNLMRSNSHTYTPRAYGNDHDAQTCESDVDDNTAPRAHSSTPDRRHAEGAASSTPDTRTMDYHCDPSSGSSAMLDATTSNGRWSTAYLCADAHKSSARTNDQYNDCIRDPSGTITNHCPHTSARVEEEDTVHRNEEATCAARVHDRHSRSAASPATVCAARQRGGNGHGSTSAAAVYLMPMKCIDARYPGSTRHPRIHLRRPCLGVCVSALHPRAGLSLLWDILSLYRDTAEPHCRRSTVCGGTARSTHTHAAAAAAVVQAVVLESSKHLFNQEDFRSSATRQRLQRRIDAAEARREARYVRRTSVLTRVRTVMQTHAHHLRARNRTSTSCLTLTVVVREGVLTRGVYFVADQAYGCVEYLLDGWGRVVERALPGMTVTVIDTHSASGCPFAGVHLLSMSDAEMQQRVHRYRQRLQWFVEVFTRRLDLLRPRGMNTLFTHLGDYGQVGMTDSLETQIVYGGKLPAFDDDAALSKSVAEGAETQTEAATLRAGQIPSDPLVVAATQSAQPAPRVADEEGGVCLGEYLAQLNHKEELAEVEQLLLPTTARLPPRLVSAIGATPPPPRTASDLSSTTCTLGMAKQGPGRAHSAPLRRSSVPTFLRSAQEAAVLETQWRSLQRRRTPTSMEEYTRALSRCLQMGILVKVDGWHVARMLTREVTRCGTSRVHFQIVGVRYGPLNMDDILFFANSVKVIVCLRTPKSGSSEMDTYMDMHDIWALHTDHIADVTAFLKWCAITIHQEHMADRGAADEEECREDADGTNARSLIRQGQRHDGNGDAGGAPAASQTRPHRSGKSDDTTRVGRSGESTEKTPVYKPPRRRKLLLVKPSRDS